MKKIITIFLFCLLAISTVDSKAQQTDEFHIDEVHSVDPNGTINLQSDDADVKIIGSDRNKVRVKVDYKLTVEGFTFGSSNKFGMIVEEKNGNLTIREKPRDFGNRGIINTRMEKYIILIETPRSVNMNIRGDDEAYEISGIDGSIHLDADDADINMTDCNGDEFSFVLDDAGLRMDRGKGNLKLNIDDGNVRIGRGNFENINVDTDDSKLEITSRFYGNGHYKFDMDDADLRLNFAGGGEVEINHDNATISTSREFEEVAKEDRKSVYRLPNGRAYIVIDSDDGNINLRVI